MTPLDNVNRRTIRDELRANAPQRLAGELAVLARFTPALTDKAEDDTEGEKQDFEEKASLMRPPWRCFRRR